MVLTLRLVARFIKKRRLHATPDNGADTRRIYSPWILEFDVYTYHDLCHNSWIFGKSNENVDSKNIRTFETDKSKTEAEMKVIERPGFIYVQLPPLPTQDDKEVSRKIQELWKKKVKKRDRPPNEQT